MEKLLPCTPGRQMGPIQGGRQKEEKKRGRKERKKLVPREWNFIKETKHKSEIYIVQKMKANYLGKICLQFPNELD